MSKTILLIDADILCFRASAAAEQRTVIVKHLKTGQEKEFTNRTAFRDRLKEKYGDAWKEKEQGYAYEDVQTAESLGVVLNNIKARLHLFEKELRPDRIELYVGGENNFRDTLPLPSRYKGSREDSIRPVHLSEAKKYVKKTLKAKIASGYEADDLLSIRAYEELNKGNNPIICSCDKDTYQADGVRVYNWLDENPEIVLVDTLGELIDKGTKGIKGTGFKFLAFQIIFGDPVDGYKPFEIVPDLKYGAKSAYKDLVNLQSTKEVCDKVVEIYKTVYPGEVKYTAWDGTEVITDWKGMLDLYFKCAYMQRKHNDQTTWQEFFEERGWNG